MRILTVAAGLCPHLRGPDGDDDWRYRDRRRPRLGLQRRPYAARPHAIEVPNRPSSNPLGMGGLGCAAPHSINFALTRQRGEGASLAGSHQRRGVSTMRGCSHPKDSENQVLRSYGGVVQRVGFFNSPLKGLLYRRLKWHLDAGRIVERLVLIQACNHVLDRIAVSHTRGGKASSGEVKNSSRLEEGDAEQQISQLDAVAMPL